MKHPRPSSSPAGEDTKGTFTTSLPGYQLGASVKVPVIDRAGLDIGMLYMHSKDYHPRDEKTWAGRPIHDGLDEVTAFFGIAVGI